MFSCSLRSLNSIYLLIKKRCLWLISWDEWTTTTTRESSSPKKNTYSLAFFPISDPTWSQMVINFIFSGGSEHLKPSCFLSRKIILIGNDIIRKGPRWASKATEKANPCPLARTRSSHSRSQRRWSVFPSESAHRPKERSPWDSNRRSWMGRKPQKKGRTMRRIPPRKKLLLITNRGGGWCRWLDSPESRESSGDQKEK